MSIPTAVFLDTSIFDGQNYNYQSTALATFVPACNERAIKLLLPDPTEREIKRHIRDRSLQALAALEDARRKAPFLAKWKRLEQKLKAPKVEEFEVHRIASGEWGTFLSQFDVVRIGYDMLRIETVMGWYDQIAPPFREGKKKKEFPDAFAVAMLDAYAQKNGIYVGVVSADPDFRAACQRFGFLLYYPTLPRFTETLLSDGARVDNLRLAIERQQELIGTAVIDEAAGLSFYHSHDMFEIHDADLEEVEVMPSIVALGDTECTVAFDAMLKARFDLHWHEPDESGYHEQRTRVRDDVEVSGTAKLALNEAGTEVSEVTFIELDQSEVKVTAVPWR